MRILHVSDAYRPRSGGIETQVGELAARQARDGHDVLVLTCSAARGGGGGWGAGPGARVDPVEDLDGVRVLRTGVPWPHPARSARAVSALFAEHRPDVVHAHLSVLSPLGILAVRAAARDGVPVTVTVHSLWWWATSLYRAADRLNGWGGWPVRWTAVSDLAAQPLRRILGARAGVGVLPNGIDAEAWRGPDGPLDGVPARATARGTGDRTTEHAPVTVVSVMRLALRKRPRALLRVVRDVRARLPRGQQLQVVLVGDGAQARAVRRRVRRYDLQDVVRLTGWLTPEEIADLYRDADVYLAPATLESFGIAALEARCAGLPIVARRRTGIADFVEDGVNGLLTDSDEGLADALVTLATRPELRRRIRATNRRAGPPASWPQVLDACRQHYRLAREAVHDPSAPPAAPGPSGTTVRIIDLTLDAAGDDRSSSLR